MHAIVKARRGDLRAILPTLSEVAKAGGTGTPRSGVIDRLSKGGGRMRFSRQPVRSGQALHRCAQLPAQPTVHLNQLPVGIRSNANTPGVWIGGIERERTCGYGNSAAPQIAFAPDGGAPLTSGR